jgi:hypothetical protein
MPANLDADHSRCPFQHEAAHLRTAFGNEFANSQMKDFHINNLLAACEHWDYLYKRRGAELHAVLAELGDAKIRNWCLQEENERLSSRIGKQSRLC